MARVSCVECCPCCSDSWETRHCTQHWGATAAGKDNSSHGALHASAACRTGAELLCSLTEQCVHICLHWFPQDVVTRSCKAHQAFCSRSRCSLKLYSCNTAVWGGFVLANFSLWDLCPVRLFVPTVFRAPGAETSRAGADCHLFVRLWNVLLEVV